MLITRRSNDADFFNLLDDLSRPSVTFDVKETLARIIEPYALKHAAYFVINLPGRSHREPTVAVTYPSAWVRRYFEAGYMQYDPVLTAGLSTIMPLDWSDTDRSTKRIKQMFGEANELGVGRHGMSFPIRGSFGEKAVISITSDASDKDWRRNRHQHMRDFQIIAHHIHRLALCAEKITVPSVSLSPRERECLRWAAMGKTASETGIILGISDRTTRFYLELARHKLNAVNVTNAVAKAISLNIVSVGL